jgi:hypothetical protein
MALAVCGALGLTVPGAPHALPRIATAAIVLLGAIPMIRLYRRKVLHPLLWREARMWLAGLAVLISLLVFFRVWARHQGLSHAAIASAILFSLGGVALIFGCCGRRFQLLGTAILTMVFGLLQPVSLAHPQYRDLLLGVFIVSTGTLMAAIIAWQLRRQKNNAS